MAINVKALLASALIELCKTKPLEKITVTMIIDKAETGRQTFYNHFKDKNDLIYWIFCRTLRGERALMNSAGLYAYLTNLYREAQKQKDFFRQACRQQGQNALSEAIYVQTYNYYKNFIVKHSGKQVMSEELEFALRFNAHGATSTYIEWAKEGMPGSADTQARYALSCMPQIMKDHLPVTHTE